MKSIQHSAVPLRESVAKLPRKVLAIASGEGAARILNLFLAVFIARKFGVRAAGAWALAQALSLYLMQGTDFGLRHTGARLVAQRPDRMASVVRFIQKRRVVLAVLMSAGGFVYGRFGPLPEDSRALVSFFALATFGYGLSLDWLAWGDGRFGRMSGWRTTVALAGACLSIAGIAWFHLGLLALPVAFAAAYSIADLWLWLGWARVRMRENGTNESSYALFGPDWKSTLFLGIGMLVNQAFSSIDTMMLGGLTNSTQTGLYSAAYKLLLLALALYYLVMQALFPELAAIPPAERGLRRLQWPLICSAFAGMVAAAVLTLLRAPLITLLFGPAFAASIKIAGPLMLAIPLDFVASVLFTVLVAWDHPRRVLVATVTAVASNVALNIFLIPRFGAMGAAWATPLSYLPFLAALFIQTCAVEPKHESPRRRDLHSFVEPRAEDGARFSLILATVGRTETIERTLQSFAKQQYFGFEVIVVDQNRDNRLMPILDRWCQSFRCIHLISEPGLSRARNAGLAQASGKIVAFPDDDCWYPEDLLKRVDQWFGEDSSHSLLSICARDEQGNEVSSRWPGVSGEIDRQGVLRTCSSICLFIERAAAIDAGGFDENMGLGSGTLLGSAEDLDLAIRILDNGAKGWFEKDIWVGHPARVPGNSDESRARGYGRGFGYLLRKHRYPAAVWLLSILRALGGLVCSCATMEFRQARFYWHSMRGRIEGYAGLSGLQVTPARTVASGSPLTGPE